MSQSQAEEMIRVFMVEDHKMVRRVMGKLIRRSPYLTLCGEAATAEAALDQIAECRPQVVLVDISLPDMNGIDLIRILYEKYPDLRLLAHSAHNEKVYGARAMQAGAHGYVMKGNKEVVEAIRGVSNGRLYVSDALQAILNESE